VDCVGRIKCEGYPYLALAVDNPYLELAVDHFTDMDSHGQRSLLKRRGEALHAQRARART